MVDEATAEPMAEIIGHHAEESTGGLTYAELGSGCVVPPFSPNPPIVFGSYGVTMRGKGALTWEYGGC